MRVLIVALPALLAAGCVSQQMAPPQPTLQAIQLLRSANYPAMRVGDFAPAPTLSPSANKSMAIRGLTLSSPYDNSFAKYLGATLEADLRGAGKLDPNSDLVVEGLLTQSYDDAGIGTGAAMLGSKFTLLRAGKLVFEKELNVDAHWDSNFVGAVAIPDAANNYTSLYDKLVLKLFSDNDFRTAIEAH